MFNVYLIAYIKEAMPSYYVLAAFLPFTMPRHYDSEEIETDTKLSAENGTNTRLWKTLLGFTFFYYFCSCGIERIYQPMVGHISKLPGAIHPISN